MTAAALAVAGVALLAVVWLSLEVLRLRRRVDLVPEEGGVHEALRRLDLDLGDVEDAVADLIPRLESVETRLPFAIRHMAVVAYDAFGDVTGRLSRSIALLNERGDGLVISLLVSREETRWFTKMVKAGAGIERLSPEEGAAVERAMQR